MMITMEIFNCFLIAMSFLALLVFVALYFVKAGYGVFSVRDHGVYPFPIKQPGFSWKPLFFSFCFTCGLQVKIHFPLPVLIFFLISL